ncbi:alpha-hydroxy acid oxidase [Thalassolituus sp. LLYu03]|uniref:alpha-hydroxy acid oxidase n=1 Tax=Thalassolituus sp. LLYu03 TaxID=3421656 RepID=UPI003D27056F
MTDDHIIRPALNHIPADIVCLRDYERAALGFMREDIQAYVNGGAADEITVRDNAQAFSKLRLINRVFGDFSAASTRTTIAGIELASPLLLAPVAHQRLLHAQGEVATAQAAAAMNVPMIVSTLSSMPLEQIAAQLDHWWFQLYWQPARDANELLLKRAHAAGARAIVITLDAPVSGVRNRAQRAGFRLPEGVLEANLLGLPKAAPVALQENDSVVFQHFMRQRPGIDELRWLRAHTELPLIAKGISHPDDAVLLKELGFNGVIISNHGGRTLDTLPPSIDSLPAIRAAVGQDFAILFDSGIRRGTDIVKALALGANAVCVGRPQLWALAVAGPLGVAHMLRILQEELEMAMAFCGTPTPADIGGHCLQNPPL